MNFIVSLLLAGLLLLVISLQRAYGSLPLKELKKRARAKDQTAILLHQAAAYGISLRVLLWIMVGLSAAGFFVYSSRHMTAWLAFLIGCLVIWIGFTRFTNKEVKQVSLWFAKTLAAPLAWLLQYLHGPISRAANFIQARRKLHVHTGLYDKEDLMDLIQDQQTQTDNRIEQYELELALHALTFGEVQVGEILTPRRMVKHVSADDTTGPLLMDELHASGFSRFPVYEGKKDHFIGTLFLKDLVKTKASAKVRDVMRREVCYVHEEQSLYDALQAILKTHHHLLIVVNSFEEYVGVVTIEDLLEQIIGQPIVDEFDQYDDLRAVAQRKADQEHTAQNEVATTVETDEVVVE